MADFDFDIPQGKKGSSEPEFEFDFDFGTPTQAEPTFDFGGGQQPMAPPQPPPLPKPQPMSLFQPRIDAVAKELLGLRQTDEQFQAQQGQMNLPEDRWGLLGDIGSGLAAGVMDVGEMSLRAIRAFDPPGGIDVVRDATTKGIEQIEQWVNEYPRIFQPSAETENSAFRKAVYGGLRGAVPSLAFGALGAATGVAGPLLGFALGAGGTFAASEFDRFIDEGMKNGMSYGDAFPYAIASGLIEGGGEALADLIGLKIFGIGGNAALPFKNSVKRMLTRGLGHYLKGTLKQLPVEVGTEMGQEYGEALMRKMAGVPTGDPLRSAVDAVGPAMVMTLLLGGAFNAANAHQLRRVRNALADANEKPEVRQNAANFVYSNLRKHDQDLAELWKFNTKQYIDSKLDIPIHLPTAEYLAWGEYSNWSPKFAQDLIDGKEIKLLPPGQGFVMLEKGEKNVAEYSQFSPELAEKLKEAVGPLALPPGQGFTLGGMRGQYPGIPPMALEGTGLEEGNYTNYSPELAKQIKELTEKKALPAGQTFETEKVSPVEAAARGVEAALQKGRPEDIAQAARELERRSRETVLGDRAEAMVRQELRRNPDASIGDIYRSIKAKLTDVTRQDIAKIVKAEKQEKPVKKLTKTKKATEGVKTAPESTKAKTEGKVQKEKVKPQAAEKKPAKLPTVEEAETALQEAKDRNAPPNEIDKLERAWADALLRETEEVKPVPKAKEEPPVPKKAEIPKQEKKEKQEKKKLKAKPKAKPKLKGKTFYKGKEFPTGTRVEWEGDSGVIVEPEKQDIDAKTQRYMKMDDDGELYAAPVGELKEISAKEAVSPTVEKVEKGEKPVTKLRKKGEEPKKVTTEITKVTKSNITHLLDVKDGDALEITNEARQQKVFNDVVSERNLEFIPIPNYPNHYIVKVGEDLKGGRMGEERKKQPRLTTYKGKGEQMDRTAAELLPEGSTEAIELSEGEVRWISDELGVGITTPTVDGRFLRGSEKNKGQDPVKIVAENVKDEDVVAEWDGFDTVKDAADYATNHMKFLNPTLVEDKKTVRWNANKNGHYGNDKMAFPSLTYPNGRNTFDFQGCGRAWFMKINNLDGLTHPNGYVSDRACYGMACYAEAIIRSNGGATASISGGVLVHGSTKAVKEMRSEITSFTATHGVEAAREKYPDFQINWFGDEFMVQKKNEKSGAFRTVKKFKSDKEARAFLDTRSGGEYRIEVKGGKGTTVGEIVTLPGPARVSANLGKAEGMDIRLGVDTDGSAWLSFKEVMKALMDTGLNKLSVYSSAYHIPPPSHPLSGKTMINVTISGYHPLPETFKRLEWAYAARAAGWNVILREVTADETVFTNAEVKLYNRLHEALLKTDFLIMEQPLHKGSAKSKPGVTQYGLPGCCKGSMANPHTCDQCEVCEGQGQKFQDFWGMVEGTAREGKIIPDKAEIDGVKYRLAEGRYDFSKAEREKAMATSRTSGAVGPKAIVPRIVRALADKAKRILDFGAGKAAAHAKALTEEGYLVDAYDFHLEGSEKYLKNKYELIYASNMINVQQSVKMLHTTLSQLDAALAQDGVIIANYPSTPRPLGLSNKQMLAEVEKVFEVKRVDKDLAGSNLVWELRKKKSGIKQFSNYAGTKIARYKNDVGKFVDGLGLFVHRNYTDIFPQKELNKAKEVLSNTHPDFEYNVVVYEKKSGAFRFHNSEDFDTAPEPKSGEFVKIMPDGKVTRRKTDTIWHHKWQWVRDDYTGFDVNESFQRSKDWASHKYESGKIGWPKNWDKWLKENKLPPNIAVETKSSLFKEATRVLKEVVTKTQQMDLFGFKQKKRIKKEKRVYTLGNAVTLDALADKTISLVGSRVETAEDIAVLCQIYRDPRFETMRYLYVKDGVLVHHEGVTSRLPHQTSSFMHDDVEGGVRRIEKIIKKTGADTLWLVHNHPSGEPVPSQQDVIATRLLAKTIPQAKGAVIINSGTYGVIDLKREWKWAPNPIMKVYGKELEIEEVVAIPDKHPRILPEVKGEWVDKILTPSVPHEQLGVEFGNTPMHIAMVGSKIKTDNGYVVLLVRDTHWRTRLIQEIPGEMLETKNVDKLKEHIRNAARDVGGVNAVIYVPMEFADSPKVKKISNRMEELIEEGYLDDIVCDEGTLGYFGLNLERKFFGQDIEGLGVVPATMVREVAEQQKDTSPAVKRDGAVWHITTREAANDILANGLDPSMAPDASIRGGEVWVSLNANAANGLWRAINRAQSFASHEAVDKWSLKHGVTKDDLDRARKQYQSDIAREELAIKEKSPRARPDFLARKITPAGYYLYIQSEFHESTSMDDSKLDIPYNEFLWNDFAQKLMNAEVVMLEGTFTGEIGPDYQYALRDDYDGIEGGMPLKEGKAKAVKDIRIVSKEPVRMAEEIRPEPEFVVDGVEEAADPVVQSFDQYFGREDVSLKKRFKEAWKRFRLKTYLLDEYHPILEFLGKKSYMLHRLLNGIHVHFEAMMRHGKLKLSEDGSISIDGRNNGFMSWAKKNGQAAFDVLRWAAAKRAIQLHINKDGFAEAEGVLTEQAARFILDELGEGPSEGRKWEDIYAEFEEWHHSILDIAQAANVITKAQRQDWGDLIYVPFYRVFEDPMTREEFIKYPGRAKQIATRLKKIKGSEKKIGEPFDNVIANWSYLLQESMRNQARHNAFFTAQRMKYELGIDLVTEINEEDIAGIKEKNGVISYTTKKGGVNVLSFLHKGKRKFFEVSDPELFAALSTVNHQRFGKFFDLVFGGPKRLLTFGATLGPAFRVANMLRDTIHTWVITEGWSFVPFIDTFKGLVSAMREDKWYVGAMAAGGLHGGSYVHAEDPRHLQKYVKHLQKGEKKYGNILDTPAKLWRFWQKLGEASENAARVSLYRQNVEAGKTGLEAAYEARDLLDFSMKGQGGPVQAMIRMVPFLGARMQGNYRLYRAATDPATRKTFFIKGLILAAASLGVWALFADDDRYKELEDYNKWTYYHVWIGGQEIRMPKPFEVGAIFSSLFESVANVTMGDEDLKFLGRFIKHTMTETFAIGIPQTIKPLAEVWANKSFFTGRQIENYAMQRLEPGERASYYDSETLKLIGKGLNISPKKMQTIARGYFATLSTFVLGGTDIFARWLGDFPERPSLRPDDYPLAGRFWKEGPARNTKYRTRLYEAMNEVDQLVATIKHMQALGDYDKARQLKKENIAKFRLSHRLTKVRQKMAQFRKKEERIWSKRNMTAEQKEEAIRAIQERRNEYERRAYEVFMKRIST